MGNDLRKKLEELTEQNRKLKAELLSAYRDALTGLWNRTFFEKFKKNIEQNNDSIGVIYIDANKLKYINDNFGHDAGDEYLADTGKLIQNTLKRKSDYAFRIGGDEFLLILALTGKEPENGLKVVLDRINDNLSQLNRERIRNDKIEISIAIGGIVKNSEICLSDTISKAEEFMYEHKKIQKKQNPSLGRQPLNTP